jgi:c(7)-type cytochrome triheme protein
MQFGEKAAVQPDERHPANQPWRYRSAVKLIVALAMLIAACCAITIGAGPVPNPAQKQQKPSQTLPASSPNDHFQHMSAEHSKMKCDQCHVRRADAIKPIMPGHRACISCHIKEFTSTGFRICANCHNGINAIRPAVLPFPERQSFGVAFSHKTHATYQNGERRAECADCHKVAGAGTTFPAHKECYVCHKSPDQVQSGEKVGGASCGECHTTTINPMPHGAVAKAYNYRFTHAVHAQGQKIACTECHNVTSLSSGTAQVAVPALKEHRNAGFQSCGGCHNGKRAFGGELVDQACARCHGRNMM